MNRSGKKKVEENQLKQTIIFEVLVFYSIILRKLLDC